MVIRYRDKNRIVAGTHPYIELFGLFVFASGLLGLMLCVLLFDEVQREYGVGVPFCLLLLCFGGWMAFLRSKLVIDSNEKTITHSSLLFFTEIWRMKDISHLDLFQMSPILASHWSTLIVSNSGNREYLPASLSQNELPLFAAIAYQNELEIVLSDSGAVVKCLKELLENNPDHYELRWLLAVAYGFKKQFWQAAHELETVVQIAPSELRLRRSYGLALMILMRFEDALAQFEMCYKTNPDDLVTQMACIDLLRILGRFSEALSRAEALYARSDDKASLVHLTYADLQQICGVPEKAIPALERILNAQSPVADKPESIHTVDALITRALALSRLKRFDEAEKDFARAMKFSHMAPLMIAHYAGFLAYRAQFAGDQREEFEKKALYQLEVVYKSPAVGPGIFYDTDFRFLRDNPKFKELTSAALKNFEERQSPNAVS